MREILGDLGAPDVDDEAMRADAATPSVCRRLA
jgi:hypothetical protein